MLIKQICAFIENKPGRLAEVTKYLAGEGIHIHAISIADTTDFGILRLIVSDHERALAVLRAHSFTVRVTDVLAVALKHKPGSLAELLTQLAGDNISVEYMYAFTSHSKEHDAMVILRLTEPEQGLAALTKNDNVHLLTPELFDSLHSF